MQLSLEEIRDKWVDIEAKRISKEEAATHIAHNFEAWIHIFEEARSA